MLTTVLSEPSALQLYPVNARGHIVGRGTQTSSFGTSSHLMLSLDLCSGNADLQSFALFTSASLVACALFCLIHSLGIELVSFLPNCQRYCCDFSRYR